MRTVTILTFLFLLLVGVTIVFPGFPPAQFLYETLGMPHPALSSAGLSAGSLMYGFTNGFFWVLVAAIAFGISSSTRKSKPLPPIPVATKLATPPLEAKEVDDRWVRMLPSATVIVSSNPAVSSSPASLPAVYSEAASEPVVMEQDVEVIDGVGPVCGGLLKNAGVKTVNDLLMEGGKETGRRLLASEVGVSYSTLVEWVYSADLLRVKGIDANYSVLLQSAGVKTVVDLSTRNPVFLSQTLRVVDRERKLVGGRIPSSETIECWVNEAKKLKPIVE